MKTYLTHWTQRTIAATNENFQLFTFDKDFA